MDGEKLVNEDALAPLAAAILDGTPIDWEDVAASTPRDHANLVAELQLLERIGNVHRSTYEVNDAVGVDVPSAWSHLQILEPVGRGTFGRVFRAWDPRLDREVALKLLDAEELGESPASPVIEEARLLARVRHPNVVTVYGAERVGRQVGLWMEFIHGHTLEQILEQRGAFGIAETARIGIELCAALGAVHGAGLVHRDLKAQNVIREAGGRLVIVDFGAGRQFLDRPSDDAAGLTGTPAYLAPECFNGAPPTAQTEIYSVGVLLFHLVTASFPVRGATAAQLRDAHGLGRRTRLRDLRPAIDQTFADIVERSLDTDPRQRFASAAALGNALSSWQRRSAVLQERPADRADVGLRRLVQRHRGWAAAGPIAALTAAVVAVVSLTDWNSVPDRTAPPTRAVAATTTSRRVTLSDFAILGRPDAQGRYISYMDYDGDLAVGDLETGEGRKLTNHGESDETTEFSALSPDGREVVYSWWTIDGAYELRAIDVDSGRLRVVLTRDQVEYPIPLEWSRDGRNILCLLLQRDGSALAALVPASGGAPRAIQRFDKDFPGTISLSRDSRHIAFDVPTANPSARDIVSVAIDGGDMQLVAGGVSDDRAPVWTPDGRGVFFLSDRAGTVDGWFVPVVDGAPRGEPLLVARNMARALPVGFSERGSYFYQLHTGMPDVQIVDLAAHTYAVVGEPRNASPIAGSTIGPDWSPDGQRFAFVVQRPTEPLIRGGRTITVQGSDGTSRVLEPALSSLGVTPPRFSPDSRTLLIRGRDLRGLWGYFTVEIASGRTGTALLIDRPNNLSNYGQYDWAPDSRALLYVHFPTGLRSKDVATDRDVLAVSNADAGFSIGGFALSPTGRSIAFSGYQMNGQDDRQVIAVANNGERPRVVVAGQPDERMALQAWTPDGLGLIYTVFEPGGRAPHAVWYINADGGGSRPLGLSIDGFTQVNSLAVRPPDGRQLAFTRGGAIDYELWNIDHFLP